LNEFIVDENGRFLAPADEYDDQHGPEVYRDKEGYETEETEEEETVSTSSVMGN